MPEPGGWFFDSVTLSNFALADAVAVLRDRYRRRGFVPTQVVDELTRGVTAGYAPLTACLDLVDTGVLRVVSLDRSERHTFRQLVGHLGEGEAGTIAVAHHRQGTVVTDDRAARRTCADLNVPVTGTLGILQAAVRDRQLTLGAANDLLRAMIQAGFHSPLDRLAGR
jgi:predicted nucleic acid-binding protein